MMASIVIRTYNESQYLKQLLETIHQQQLPNVECEVIIVDSGSTDGTLAIAESFPCRMVHIPKHEFSFGRSLNYGCQVAQGQLLVFISGHCIPTNEHWLEPLLDPLIEGQASYSYGRQIGDGGSSFSEHRLFNKYYPPVSQIQQQGYFCNNANAALLKKVWEKHAFDEELTGLEDMALAKQLAELGHRIAYVADACVYHLHRESWGKIKTRYQREAIALQHIMPQVHITWADFLRFYVSAVVLDVKAAHKEQCLRENFKQILLFRLMQFWGSYRGNHDHRKLSKHLKEKYFYPE